MVIIILGVIALLVSILTGYILITANIDNTINMRSKADLLFAAIMILSALVTPVYVVITLIEKIW